MKSLIFKARIKITKCHGTTAKLFNKLVPGDILTLYYDVASTTVIVINAKLDEVIKISLGYINSRLSCFDYESDNGCCYIQPVYMDVRKVASESDDKEFPLLMRVRLLNKIMKYSEMCEVK